MNNRFIFSSILAILVLLGAYYVVASITSVEIDSPVTLNGTNITSITFQCTAAHNISGDNSPTNVSNGTGIVRNISIGFNFTGTGGALGNNGSIVINATQNLSNGTNTSVFTIANLPEGRFLWGCLAANFSAVGVIFNQSFRDVVQDNNATNTKSRSVNISINRTVLVDGSAPDNITLIFPNRSADAIPAASFTNGTVTVTWKVADNYMTNSLCNVTVNGVRRAENVIGVSNNSANFTVSVTGFTSLITANNWSVACSDYVGNTNSTSSNSGTVNITDAVAPYEVGPISFKGTVDSRADVEAVKFDFGSKVTITGCNGTENVDYFNSNATIDIKRPGSTGFSNVKNATSGIASFVFDDTSELGTYEVNCSYIDGAGNLNSTVKKFEILSTRVRGSGAAAIPGFKFSKGTTLIGADSRNDAGSLTPTDSSWLFRSGGTIVFQVAGARHSFQVKEIKDKSVVVTVSSTPFDVEVNEGETKNVDVDGDGTADVAITLNGFTPSRHADLTFKAVGGIPAEAGPGVSGEKAPTAGPITAGVGNGTWLIVGIIVVVLIVGYFLIKRR